MNVEQVESLSYYIVQCPRSLLLKAGLDLGPGILDLGLLPWNLKLGTNPNTTFPTYRLQAAAHRIGKGCSGHNRIYRAS